MAVEYQRQNRKLCCTGIRANWELIRDQLGGQQAIVGYQREELAVPEIGEVYKITTPDNLTSQFVRITGVDHSITTFTYHNGAEYVDFIRRKLEMEISAPLITTFVGAAPVPGDPENRRMKPTLFTAHR